MTKLPKGSKLLEQRDGVAVVGLPQDPRDRYPLWVVSALQKDVARAENAIKTFEEAIADQRSVINERKAQISLCEERDRAIATWEKNRADSDIPSGD